MKQTYAETKAWRDALGPEETFIYEMATNAMRGLTVTPELKALVEAAIAWSWSGPGEEGNSELLAAVRAYEAAQTASETAPTAGGGLACTNPEGPCKEDRYWYGGDDGGWTSDCPAHGANCPRCMGDGYIGLLNCTTCNGTGKRNTNPPAPPVDGPTQEEKA